MYFLVTIIRLEIDNSSHLTIRPLVLMDNAMLKCVLFWTIVINRSRFHILTFQRSFQHFSVAFECRLDGRVLGLSFGNPKVPVTTRRIFSLGNPNLNLHLPARIASWEVENYTLADRPTGMSCWYLDILSLVYRLFTSRK